MYLGELMRQPSSDSKPLSNPMFKVLQQ